MDLNKVIQCKKQKKEEETMDKEKKTKAEVSPEKAEKKLKDKRNTFTLIYILVGMFIIAVLAMFIWAFIVGQ